MKKAEAIAARQRCEKATPGPWGQDKGGNYTDIGTVEYTRRRKGLRGNAVDGFIAGIHYPQWHDKDRLESSIADADFIAASRTDLPSALDMLERAMEVMAYVDTRNENFIFGRDEITALLCEWEAPMPSEDRDRQMVWWIAEKVMGWRRAGAHPLYVGDHGMPSNGVVWHVTQTDPCHIEQFDPLTSISDAVDALEAWCGVEVTRDYDIIRESNSFASVDCHAGRKYRVSLSNFGGGTLRDIIGRHDTLPRAICEALCKATGFEG